MENTEKKSECFQNTLYFQHLVSHFFCDCSIFYFLKNILRSVFRFAHITCIADIQKTITVVNVFHYPRKAEKQKFKKPLLFSKTRVRGLFTTQVKRNII